KRARGPGGSDARLMDKNRLSASGRTGRRGTRNSRWLIWPSLGNCVMAVRTVGNHAVRRNQTTAPAANNATMNCTSNTRLKEARAKAATPRKVSGCQAKGARGEDV